MITDKKGLSVPREKVPRCALLLYKQEAESRRGRDVAKATASQRQRIFRVLFPGSLLASVLSFMPHCHGCTIIIVIITCNLAL